MKSFGVVLLIITVAIAGCALFIVEEPPPPVPLETIRETIAWAQENLGTIEELQAHEVEAYQENYQRCRESLLLAENSFQEELYEQAYFAAQESINTSQQILRQFYADTVVASAQDAKTRIEAITMEDPENPLQEFLPALTEILDYSEKLENAQDEIDISKVLMDLERVKEIGNNTRKTMRKTLESDISFDSGRYKLSDKGKQALQTYCDEIVAGKREFDELYPERKIIINVHVAGYTDQVDFREGTNLLKQLKEETQRQVPRAQPGLRKFLNQRLSELRAKVIADFITGCILLEEPDAPIEQKSIGLGEELPPRLPSPYPLSDPRRRICKIYTYVLVR